MYLKSYALMSGLLDHSIVFNKTRDKPHQAKGKYEGAMISKHWIEYGKKLR